MDEMCQDAVQFVILGTGEERYENMFRHFDWKYGKSVSANIYYSEEHLPWRPWSLTEEKI